MGTTNNDIKSSQVRLISSTGTQLGIVSIQKALQYAKNEGLDLVEVSPDTTPPVCKIMDYSKHKYESNKKTNKSKTIQLKEITMKPNIGMHDLDIKINQIRKFIEKKHKVKITVNISGRISTPLIEKSKELINIIINKLDNIIKIDQPLINNGKLTTIQITSIS